MGILDMFRSSDDTEPTALRQASAAEPSNDLLSGLVAKVMNTGVDGIGPLRSAREAADRATSDGASADEAIEHVGRSHVVSAAISGGLSGLGGFITFPIALPANVAAFYLLASRLTGAIATLRGHDVDDPAIRTAVGLAMAKTGSDDLFTKAGAVTSSLAGRAAMSVVPASAVLLVNKGLGFRLIRSVGTRLVGRVSTRLIPVAGAVLGAAVDAYLMHRVAGTAKREFPAA